MTVYISALIDGFGRLVELAPGAPEIECQVNDNEAQDWLQVGGDLRNAISEHVPESAQIDPLDPHAKELVEA